MAWIAKLIAKFKNKTKAKVIIKNKPQVKLRLQPSVKQGGKDGINVIGSEAHDLLLNYYLKSEAFYIRGIYMFEQNLSSLEFI